MIFAKILPLLFLVAIFVIGLPFVAIIMGETDAGVDLQGTDYEEQYDSTTDTAITSLSLMQFVPLLAGITTLLIAVLGIFAVVKKKGVF